MARGTEGGRAELGEQSGHLVRLRVLGQPDPAEGPVPSGGRRLGGEDLDGSDRVQPVRTRTRRLVSSVDLDCDSCPGHLSVVGDEGISFGRRVHRLLRGAVEEGRRFRRSGRGLELRLQDDSSALGFDSGQGSARRLDLPGQGRLRLFSGRPVVGDQPRQGRDQGQRHQASECSLVFWPVPRRSRAGTVVSVRSSDRDQNSLSRVKSDGLTLRSRDPADLELDRRREACRRQRSSGASWSSSRRENGKI